TRRSAAPARAPPRAPRGAGDRGSRCACRGCRAGRRGSRRAGTAPTPWPRGRAGDPPPAARSSPRARPSRRARPRPRARRPRCRARARARRRGLPPWRATLPRVRPLCKPAGPCYTARMAEQAQVLGPTSHYFYSQRLKLHYVDWGNADERALLLLHGGRDHCRSWDWVAADLRRDFHLIAPDLRGHGDSAWAVGSTYSMIDYVLDLAALLKTLDLFPITIIGHSLGARVALQYAGIYPDRVARLVAIEGLGPPA